MNKAELVEAIASETRRSKLEAEAILNSAMGAIKGALKRGDSVTLVGFGTFSRVKRGARVGRNPKTREEVRIPPTHVARFKPGRELKEALR